MMEDNGPHLSLGRLPTYLCGDQANKVQVLGYVKENEFFALFFVFSFSLLFFCFLLREMYRPWSLVQTIVGTIQ